VFTGPLLRNDLLNPVVPQLLGAEYIGNTASVIVACWTVFFGAVAWQRVDQICYITITINALVNFYMIYYRISFQDPKFPLMSSPPHKLHVRHVVITDCRKLQGMALR
jgi:hypothetical protein